MRHVIHLINVKNLIRNLLITANSLNRLLIKENINLAHLYPKVYYFNNSNIKNLENLSMNTKNKYLGELFNEISNLRKELLSIKGNKIIYDNYYHYLIDKSDYNKLNNDEKIFLSNYRQFNVNSKILEFKYDEKSFFKKIIKIFQIKILLVINFLVMLVQ